MDIGALLTFASKNYSEEYSQLLEHLYKCSNQLTHSKNEDDLPLLIFKTKEIYLWIKDDSVFEHPFLFSDPEEILYLLYQFFGTGGSVYISDDLPVTFSKQFIKDQIEKCLLENDVESFNKWVKQLKSIE
ncbi:hypothetical protein [Bacillus toyonensis]|uniref:hypothetical protein n=1 Tax=Bacillus toyonensis TaxID=155322 RepID=UPI002E234C0C|nr:hypothetical protein [Bacillus toyonensis]